MENFHARVLSFRTRVIAIYSGDIKGSSCPFVEADLNVIKLLEVGIGLSVLNFCLLGLQSRDHRLRRHLLHYRWLQREQYHPLDKRV